MIITTLCQKGGPGKTTTAVNLMAASERPGLVIDVDVMQRDVEKYVKNMPNVEFSIDLADAKKQRGRLVVINTPGTFTDLTRDALLISDLVIVTCDPDPETVVGGVARSFESIARAGEKNKKIQARVLFTKVDKSATSTTILSITRALAEWPCYETEIPYRKADFSHAVAAEKPLVLLKPNSPGADAYRKLAQEVFNSPTE